MCVCVCAQIGSGLGLVNKWEIRVRHICGVSLIYIGETDQRGEVKLATYHEGMQ